MAHCCRPTMPRKVECQNGSDPSKAQKTAGKNLKKWVVWVAISFYSVRFVLFMFLVVCGLLRFSLPVVVFVCGKDLNARAAANVLR